MKKIVLILLSFLLVFSYIGCNNTQSDTTDTSNTPISPNDDITLADGDKIIASVDGIDISVYALRYFYVSAYRDFYQTNYSDISKYFDPNLPLRDQAPTHPDYKEYATWYDYFLSIAKRDLEYYVAFARDAKKDGVQLSAEEKESISATVAEMEENAASYDATFSEYMEDFEMMGPGVTPDTVKDAYSLFQLATKYSRIKYESFNVTATDIEKEYLENKKDYSTVDYNIITIVPKFDATSTDEEKETAKQEALGKADAFTSYIESGKDFYEAYKLIYPGLTDTEYTEFLNSYSYEKVEYVKDDTTSEWLFNEERKDGDINKTVDTQGKIKIVQLVSSAHKIDDSILNIRYIYIDLSLNHYNEVTAPTLAKEIIDQIKQAEDKDKKFKDLVALYSNDTNTNKTGGLIENIIPSSTSLPQNVIDWCFEDDRKLYDCDYQKYESYGVVCGYFITFISSYGRPYYEYIIETNLKSKMLSDYIEDITKNLTLEYDSSLSSLIFK